ncbi:MAG: hypothetical protein ACKO2Z_33220, partial [Sphaerospermopsis kisseleviana]
FGFWRFISSILSTILVTHASCVSVALGIDNGEIYIGLYSRNPPCLVAALWETKYCVTGEFKTTNKYKLSETFASLILLF